MRRILFFFAIFISFFGYSQTLVYSISTKNKQLGNLRVERSKIDSIYQINVNSTIEFKFFIKIILNYKLNCFYKENELIYSSVSSYVNGKLNSSIKTEKLDKHYKVTLDGQSSIYLQDIGLSGAMSYYKEPLDMSTLYSDFYGYDKKVEMISEHNYKITNPKNGQVSEYFYKNGILKQAIIHHFLMSFTLQLIQQK